MRKKEAQKEIPLDKAFTAWKIIIGMILFIEVISVFTNKGSTPRNNAGDEPDNAEKITSHDKFIDRVNRAQHNLDTNAAILLFIHVLQEQLEKKHRSTTVSKQVFFAGCALFTTVSALLTMGDHGEHHKHLRQRYTEL